MSRPNPLFWWPKPPMLLSYGVTVLSVAAALTIAWWLELHLESAPVALLLCAVMLSAWHGGVGPGLLATALSLLTFKYYFVPSIYSLAVEVSQIPRLLIFALSALFAGSLSAAQRSTAGSLSRACDHLDETVRGLNRINEALQAENAERKRAQEDLRVSEAKFRALSETAPAAIFIYQRNKFQYVNPAVEVITGYSQSELLKMNFWDTAHPDSRELVKARGLARQRGEPVPIRYEFKILTKTGEERWLDFTDGKFELEGSLAIVGMALDVTERKRAEEELQRSRDQLRALAARLQSVREEERTTVAREIHDELGQGLTAIRIDLSSLIHELPGDAKQQSNRAESVVKLVDETIQAVRRISTQLRPGILDDLGLVAAIEWAAEEFEARTGTRCRLDLPPGDILTDPERATALFRIFQETLTNIARHANATQVDVRMAKENGDLLLEVRDDGKGISEEQLSGGESLGILGMRERASLLGGEITISGIRGKGTTVSVRIPGPPPAPPEESN